MEFTELQTPLTAQRQARCAPTNCPVRSALSMLAEDKWRLVVLFELAASGERKFGELLRAVGGVRTKALTKSLRALEANNLVHREVIVGTPTRVSYRLTDSALKVITDSAATERLGADSSGRAVAHGRLCCNVGLKIWHDSYHSASLPNNRNVQRDRGRFGS